LRTSTRSIAANGIWFRSTTPPLQAVRGNAAAVQKDERRAGALHAQVGGGRAVVAALLARDDVGVGSEIVEARCC
jgi:hypothetical protein